MNIRVNYGEVQLGRLVKAAVGKRNKEKKGWELSCGYVQALGLTQRIVD